MTSKTLALVFAVALQAYLATGAPSDAPVAAPTPEPSPTPTLSSVGTPAPTPAPSAADSTSAPTADATLAPSAEPTPAPGPKTIYIVTHFNGITVRQWNGDDEGATSDLIYKTAVSEALSVPRSPARVRVSDLGAVRKVNAFGVDVSVEYLNPSPNMTLDFINSELLVTRLTFPQNSVAANSTSYDLSVASNSPDVISAAAMSAYIFYAAFAISAIWIVVGIWCCSCCGPKKFCCKVDPAALGYGTIPGDDKPGRGVRRV